MKEVNEAETAPLSTKQRQFLKGLAHPLSPLVLIGKEGLSKGVITMIATELGHRELVKVKIGNNSGLEKKDTSELVSSKTKSHMVQLIGKTIVLYKPNPKLPKDKRIRLPKS